jgi:rRNA maturation protein Rpf1
MSNELECHPGINLQLKIKLKDRALPLRITFHYESEKQRDLTVYYSHNVKIPDELQNHGNFSNVSTHQSLS